MQIKSLLIAAAAATTTLANPLLGLGQSTVPGYPWGLGSCLTRQQATWIVQQFKSVITNPNRDAAVKLASVLLDDSFSETSDSINVLAGHPVSISFLPFPVPPTSSLITYIARLGHL